jgi:RimJ/RimL family protein N-acetyltransferase
MRETPLAFPLELETPRLILRQWNDSDGDVIADMNADPEVMHFFPKTRDRAESDAMIDRLREKWRNEGFSFAAVEVKGGGLIGFTGLSWSDFPPHLAPCVEIGWRLARHAWGQGYATEAAQACLAQGFDAMGLSEVVAFSVAGNRRSRAVMERLGMTYNMEDDFDDPDEPIDSPLRPLVLYRLSREDWREDWKA